MRRLISGIIAFALAEMLLCSFTPDWKCPQVFAHRGCWIEDFIPENSLDGVEMAAMYGYPTTECDVRRTKDGVLVLMHDASINRTMRNASDYSQITDVVRVSDHTFSELRDKYVLASDDPDRRRPIPSFEEYLKKCGECGIVPILHCDIYEGYEAAHKWYGSNWIAFTTEYDVCRKVRRLDPDVLILYAIDKMEGDPSPAEVIAKLDGIGGRCGISSMGHYDLREEMCTELHKHGYCAQSSIFRTPHEVAAMDNGADILLTDFAWFQKEGRIPYSRFSKQALKLGENEKIGKRWPEMEYSAMTVDITFKGYFDIVVNGKRTYRINHDRMEVEHLGFRCYREAPSIELISLETGGRVEEIEVDIYKIDRR